MDSIITAPGLNGDFLFTTLGIILIDIVLSGDNSVVIAMAVHGLPKALRIRGILIGTLGAVLLRVLFTLIASHLMEIPFLKIAGGLAVLWIAVKLLLEDEEVHEGRRPASSVWHAVWIMMVADVTMSLDNVLAVAGISRGDMTLLWWSLGLSIPLVVFASTMLSNLMDRFPVILVLGAALLGKVGGEMIITDPGLVNWFPSANALPIRWGVQAAATLGVLALAWRLRRRRAAVDDVLEAGGTLPGSGASPEPPREP